MNRRSNLIGLFVATLVVFLPSATSARAGDGAGGYLEAKGAVAPGGVSSSQTKADTTGVVTRTGNARYVAVPARGAALIERIDPSGGQVVRKSLVTGGFTIPTVAIDGSLSGLSADGSRLALVQPLTTFPQAVTRLRVLNTTSLRTDNEIALRGSYSFDAISPNGRLLYLIQYTSPPNPTRYLVRAYDVTAGHMLSKPVIDPSEGGRPMTGRPITRVTSPDGRWAYTLYDGSDEGPFIHALDTSRHRAVCVDLGSISLPKNLSVFRLAVSPDGGQITVLGRGAEPVATVYTGTFEVTRATTSTANGGGVPWLLAAPIALAACITATGIVLLRRRRGGRLAAGGA
jgi:hypothetical protein